MTRYGERSETNDIADRGRTADLGILALRLGVGGLLAGHGAQKLFGWFGGYGLEGTGGWLESLGLRPGKRWATLAGVSEFGGGALTALGLGGPIGPIALQGAMATAIRQSHWGKPVWVSEGGAETPLLFMFSGLALGLTGPGRYSVDRMFGVKVPVALTVLTGAGVVAGLIMTEQVTAAAKRSSDEAVAGAEPSGEANDAAASGDGEAEVTGT